MKSICRSTAPFSGSVRRRTSLSRGSRSRRNSASAASASSQSRPPHVNVGLVAGDGGALVLPLLVGLPRAKELLFLGGRVSPQEAVRLGIANRMVPADELLNEAMELAEQLAAMPAQALRETKRVVNLHLEQAMAAVLEPALLAERETMHSPDHISIIEKIITHGG
ncbi:enoyl-CoA hydratase/isomerase family protein [Streptomyces canus]|uniref:enoyl-CoA hydratase/isomerase family protein n=1 Tax=Streptomyces canus TaxID=58343 RepID=UPI003442246E|nr:enoyl-CoA hydratase-related protein [Streptomyces canus]WSZ56327.1 enoyl-CoA hydratase-related protein [Streptomyces canus]